MVESPEVDARAGQPAGGGPGGEAGARPDPALADAAAALLARRPGAEPLDARALARLAEVMAAAPSPDQGAADDGAAPAWLDAAGLRDADSCGYPVAGGYADVRGDLVVLPAVVADPARADAVMGRLLQEWADDYVLTGTARRDHPWRQWATQ